MPSSWTGKPCARCGARKGEKYAGGKYCGNCTHFMRKQRSANAHARALEKRYGITREDYWNLYHFQGGTCYICQRATGKTKRLTVDHDHRTGRVRGLLCSVCNNILGHFRDDPVAAARIIEYLSSPPFARMIGAKRSTIDGALDGGDRGDPAEG